MNVINDAQIALGNLQDNTIGLFKLHGTTQLQLVIRKEEDWLQVVTVGTLGGISPLHITADRGQLVMFDEGETIGSLRANPYKLQDYVKRFGEFHTATELKS